jgi:hypothetical protein
MERHLSKLAIAIVLLVNPFSAFCESRDHSMKMFTITRPEAPVASKGPADIYIKSIWLALDDGMGKAGKMVSGFKPDNNPLHCVVRLSRAKVGTKVKFIWTAIDAGGMKNYKIITLQYVTKPWEDLVDGQINIPSAWPSGKYKVEASINKQSISTEFRITNEPGRQPGVVA